MLSCCCITVTDAMQADRAFFRGLHTRELNRLIATDAFFLRFRDASQRGTWHYSLT
ncbi:MAG: hypothetical protein ACJATK_001042 [Paracoccaceae bacterium]|jgi:hypothetical protein